MNVILTYFATATATVTATDTERWKSGIALYSYFFENAALCRTLETRAH